MRIAFSLRGSLGQNKPPFQAPDSTSLGCPSRGVRMTVVATFIVHLLYARAGFLFGICGQPFPPQSALYSAESQRLSKNIG